MIKFMKRQYYRMKMRVWAWIAGRVYHKWLDATDEFKEQRWDMLYEVCAYEYTRWNCKLILAEEL